MAYAQVLRDRAVRLALADVSDRDISVFLGVPINTVINWRVKAAIVRKRGERVVRSMGLAPARCTTRYIETDEYGRPVQRRFA